MSFGCGNAAAVMAGGACGALARTLLDGAADGLVPGFPAGILCINIAGAFCMGLLAGSAARLPSRAAAFLGTGFLGGFTTFSTFALDTVTLASSGFLPAAANVLLSAVPGVCAAGAGWRAAAVFSKGSQADASAAPGVRHEHSGMGRGGLPSEHDSRPCGADGGRAGKVRADSGHGRRIR